MPIITHNNPLAIWKYCIICIRQTYHKNVLCSDVISNAKWLLWILPLNGNQKPLYQRNKVQISCTLGIKHTHKINHLGNQLSEGVRRCIYHRYYIISNRTHVLYRAIMRQITRRVSTGWKPCWLFCTFVHFIALFRKDVEISNLSVLQSSGYTLSESHAHW